MIVSQITDKFAFAKISCCNERCKIKTNRDQNFVMLKGERIAGSPPVKMCDCIVFRDDKKIVFIELKSKSLDVSKICEKFTKSAEKSLLIVDSFGQRSNFQLFFILLAKNYSNNSAFEQLRRSILKIQGENIICSFVNVDVR